MKFSTTRYGRQRRTTQARRTKWFLSTGVILTTLALGYVGVSAGGPAGSNAPDGDEPTQEPAGVTTLQPFNYSSTGFDGRYYWTSEADAVRIGGEEGDKGYGGIRTDLASQQPVLMWGPVEQSPAPPAAEKAAPQRQPVVQSAPEAPAKPKQRPIRSTRPGDRSKERMYARTDAEPIRATNVPAAENKTESRQPLPKAVQLVRAITPVVAEAEPTLEPALPVEAPEVMPALELPQQTGPQPTAVAYAPEPNPVKAAEPPRQPAPPQQLQQVPELPSPIYTAQAPTPVSSPSDVSGYSAMPTAEPGGPLPYYNNQMLPEGEVIMEGETMGDVMAHDGVYPMDLYDPGTSVPCGYPCPPGAYVTFEAMMLDTTSRHPTISSLLRLPGSDYEPGVRVTAGRRFNCIDGVEAVFAGLFEWESERMLVDPSNSLNTWLQPHPPVTIGDLSAFNNARIHYQRLKANLNSIELNRTWNGWDVFKMLAGMRYMQLEEDFFFYSQNGVGEEGFLAYETNNYLIGGQIGAEWIYPIGRLHLSSRGKFGGFFGWNDTNATLVNNGNLIAAAFDSPSIWSVMGEFGVFANYHITRAFRLRAGYEAWYIYGATFVRDVPLWRLASFGRNRNRDGDAFFHGGSVGCELVW